MRPAIVLRTSSANQSSDKQSFTRAPNACINNGFIKLAVLPLACQARQAYSQQATREQQSSKQSKMRQFEFVNESHFPQHMSTNTSLLAKTHCEKCPPKFKPIQLSVHNKQRRHRRRAELALAQSSLAMSVKSLRFVCLTLILLLHHKFALSGK